MPRLNWSFRDRSRRRTVVQARMSGLTLPDVQLELPAIPVPRHTPQLERADFGDPAFERHRHAHVVLAGQIERDLQRAELLEVVAPILDEIAHRIFLPDQ